MRGLLSRFHLPFQILGSVIPVVDLLGEALLHRVSGLGDELLASGPDLLDVAGDLLAYRKRGRRLLEVGAPQPGCVTKRPQSVQLVGLGRAVVQKRRRTGSRRPPVLVDLHELEPS